MLSVRSPGEAVPGSDEPSMDPAVFSYIDEKLDFLLGRCREEFDRGLTAENLGAMFGGYGSFLPASQRSPMCRPGAPSSHCQGEHQKTPVLIGTSICKNNKTSRLPFVEKTCSGMILSSLLNDEEPVPQHDSVNKSDEDIDPKDDIKLGIDNTEAVYSVPGLNTSSSEHEDPDGSRVHSLQSQLAANESPSAILKIMTSFPILGVDLLSPLSDSWLNLSKKETPFPNNCKAGDLPIQERCADIVLPVKNVKDFIDKEMMPDVKSKGETPDSDSKHDPILKRNITNLTPEVRIPISEDLDISILSGSRSADLKTESQMIGDSVKVTSRVPEVSKEPNMITQMDTIHSATSQELSNLKSAQKSTMENILAVSVLTSKERKNSCEDVHSEDNSKVFKSPKNKSKVLSREHHRDANLEKVSYKSKLLEKTEKAKLDNANLGQDNQSFTISEKASGVSQEVIIKENWVACDLCNEWRLLPYGMDHVQFKKLKWNCSMQTWLPGLNKCHLKEAVTTDALNALYQIPAPENDINLNGHKQAAVPEPTVPSAKKDKQKVLGREKVLGRYSDGVDILGNINESSISKRKREGVDHNVFKSSKKSKKDFECDSNLDFPSSFKRKKDELDVIQSEDQRPKKLMKETSSSLRQKTLKSGSSGDQSPPLFVDRNVGKSSLCSKENKRRSRSGVEICVLKVSNGPRKQTKLPSRKLVSRYHLSRAENDSHGCSTYGSKLLSESCIAQEKDARGQFEKREATISRLPKTQKTFDSRAVATKCSKYNTRENLQCNEKSFSHFISDGGKSLLIPSSRNKQEIQTQGSEVIPKPTNGSRKKDGCPAAIKAMKDATDLKLSAGRLKNDGLELESANVYFEAALEFLHVAYLWELPPSLENAKHEDAIQSMEAYAEAAQLFEYCALEFEKSKQMAAAALAYKCMQVAHFKIAYFKQPGASMDRRELQTALQMNSPSSFATDVNNSNNNGGPAKAASAKGTAMPQISGNPALADHNLPKVLRLLNYSNSFNCAFEATRKSQSAFKVAIANLENNEPDQISSVKVVLDFNFHKIIEFLRLVRLSMASIHC